MPLFDMNTRPETFVSLIHCIIDDTLSQAMPDLRQTLLQFMESRRRLRSSASARLDIPRARRTNIGDRAFCRRSSRLQQFVVIDAECTFVACF